VNLSSSPPRVGHEGERGIPRSGVQDVPLSCFGVRSEQETSREVFSRLHPEAVAPSKGESGSPATLSGFNSGALSGSQDQASGFAGGLPQQSWEFT
jgi:hypothetical protein